MNFKEFTNNREGNLALLIELSKTLEEQTAKDNYVSVMTFSFKTESDLHHYRQAINKAVDNIFSARSTIVRMRATEVYHPAHKVGFTLMYGHNYEVEIVDGKAFYEYQGDKYLIHENSWEELKPVIEEKNGTDEDSRLGVVKMNECVLLSGRCLNKGILYNAVFRKTGCYINGNWIIDSSYTEQVRNMPSGRMVMIKMLRDIEIVIGSVKSFIEGGSRVYAWLDNDVARVEDYGKFAELPEGSWKLD